MQCDGHVTFEKGMLLWKEQSGGVDDFECNSTCLYQHVTSRE